MSETIHHPDQLDLVGAARPRPSRRDPPKPIITRELFSPDGTECHGVIRQWLPRARQLAWLVLAPRHYNTIGRDEVLTRITRWTYRWGFGGFLVVGLYPIRIRSLLEVDAWARDLGELKRQDRVTSFTRLTAGLGLQEGCKNLVLATGPLTEEWQVEDFRTFGDYWGQHVVAPARWRCLGVTEDGWPLAPVSRGRTPPPDDVELEPWRRSRVRRLVSEDRKTRKLAAEAAKQIRREREAGRKRAKLEATSEPDLV